MVAVSAEPRGKDLFALKKAWAHPGRPRRCTATVQKWAFEFSRRRSHRVDAIKEILSLARDAQSSVKYTSAKRFAKLQKPVAALCSLPIVLAALENLVAPQPLGDKAAARSNETGSIAEATDHCYAASNGGSIVGMDVTDHAPTSYGVSFAACTTGRSTANSTADSSGSATFISLRLLEGEELVLQFSPIPSSIVEVGDGVTRKWSFQDLVSNIEDNVAKIIGGGCFGEIIYYYSFIPLCGALAVPVLALSSYLSCLALLIYVYGCLSCLTRIICGCPGLFRFCSLVFPLLNPFPAMMSFADYFHARFLLSASFPVCLSYFCFFVFLFCFSRPCSSPICFGVNSSIL